MSIVLHLADGTTRYLRHARTNEARQRRDRQQYRSPFGTTWKTSGSRNRLPERVSISVEVWAGADYQEVTYGGETVTYEGEPVWSQSPFRQPTLEDLAPVLDAIIIDCQAAERIETMLGHWLIEGVQTAIPQPIAGGYRLDVTWLAAGPRTPEDSYGFGAYGAGAYGGS